MTLLATFATPEALLAAAREVAARGWRQEAMTPYPVDGLAEATGFRGSPLPWIMLAGFILGAGAIYALQAYSVLVAYPINVGGRPLHSWPAFLIPAFEGGILGAAVSGFIGMIALNGLPRLNHPAFDAPSFSHARGDRFFLMVEAAPGAADLLRDLGAAAVEEAGR